MKRLLPIFFLFIIQITFGQTKIDSPDLEKMAFDLLGESSNNSEAEGLYETLYQLYFEKIDLNNCSVDDLMKLYFLSSAQIESILEYRIKSGGFLTIYELKSVPGLDAQTFNQLIHFVKTTNTDTPSKRKYRPTSTVQLRYSNKTAQEGFQTLFRLKTKVSRTLKIGLVAENDPKEIFQWNPKNKYYGTDHTSFFISKEFNNKLVKQVILGDYNVQIGQGITNGTGFFSGLGQEPIRTIERKGMYINPSSTSWEGNHYRGISMVFQKKSWKALTFLSRNFQDATLNSDSVDNIISSWYSNGLHRTESELNRRKQLGVTAVGTAIQWQNNFQTKSMGLYANYSKFDYVINRNADELYNLHSFRGDESIKYGMFYTYHLLGVRFFGENAIDHTSNMALVNGASFSPLEFFKLIFLHRYYSPQFQSFNGNSFNAGGNINNETGIYTGASIEVNKFVNLQLWYDFYRHPWLKYTADAPTFNSGKMIKANINLLRNNYLWVMFRSKERERNSGSVELNYNNIAAYNKYEWIAQNRFNYQKFSFLSRIQFNKINQAQEEFWGYALIQGIKVDFKKSNFSYRTAYYHTDDFNNRFYIYEEDVRWAFSIPFLYETGLRQYLLYSIEAIKNWNLGIKMVMDSKFKDKKKNYEMRIQLIATF